MTNRHDVAIVSFGMGRAYERPPMPLGGAERQMTLLAGALAQSGKRVALVVHARGELTAPPAESGIRLFPVRFAEPLARRRAERIRRFADLSIALLRADADVYIVRGGGPIVGMVAAFCRARGRRFVFSSAIDGDWTLETMSSRGKRWLHSRGVKSSDAAVVQSRQQRQLATRAFPRLRHVIEIPSFGEELELDGGTGQDSAAPPRKFVWISRVMEYKQPLRYLDLASELPEAEFLMVARMAAASLPQDLVAEVRRRAAELPNVELHDEMPRDELMSRIRCAPALVSTSRLEGMPNVFLEAWARGVPVISLDFDPDGVIGRHELGVAAHGDWQAFVMAARSAWNRGGVDTVEQERLRSYVQNRHTTAAVASHWSQLLDDVRAGSPSRASEGTT